jgi:hypothetical protein
MQVYESPGRPKAFTVTSRIEFDRVPDAAYTVEDQHYARPNALSPSNSTNAILTKYPSVYLYAIVYHAQIWAQDENKAALYQGLLNKQITNANAKSSRLRHGPAQAAIREGATP